jgi:hypothetical protein
VVDAVIKFLERGKDEQVSIKRLDPTLQFDTSESERWGEMLLERLLRERRKMPKAERLAKFRNDSVDEVDTTDLENWVLKGREVVAEKKP